MRTIHLYSNITVGAFYNRPYHISYEYAASVNPGFTIDETPQHLIYLIGILDQATELVDFRREKIIICLELKQLMKRGD